MMKDKIMLIVKNEAMLDMMSFLLDDEGYEVVVAQKPIEISSVYRTSPDLIILQNGHSGEGAQLCQQIKMDEQIKHIPLILASTHTDLPKHAAVCRADDYILMPFNIETLLELISKLLKKRTSGTA